MKGMAKRAMGLEIQTRYTAVGFLLQITFSNGFIEFAPHFPCLLGARPHGITPRSIDWNF
jgi:hypothetical protein